MPAPSNPAERSGAAKSKEEEQAEGARGIGRGGVCDQTEARRAGMHARVYSDRAEAVQGPAGEQCHRTGSPSPPAGPVIGLAFPRMISITLARTVS